MENFAALVREARSCRRFAEDTPVGPETLRKLVDCARTTTSARNWQPLRYFLVSDEETRLRVFAHTNWATALGWGGPPPGERPTGFIAILSVVQAGTLVYYDTAIAAQTMQLHAAGMGLGCCMLNNFPRDPIRGILAIPADMEIMLQLAFGVPKEKRVILDARAGDDLQYWRDAKGVHYVPKLVLEDVVFGER